MKTIVLPNDTALTLYRVLKQLQSNDSWIGYKWREQRSPNEAIGIDRVIRELEANGKEAT